jgi:hypothetical protein
MWWRIVSYHVICSQKWFASLIGRTFPAISLEALKRHYDVQVDVRSDRYDQVDQKRLKQKLGSKPSGFRGGHRKVYW